MWSVTLCINLLLIVAFNDAFLITNRANLNEKLGIKNNYESKTVRRSYFTQWRDHFNTSDFTTFDQKIYIHDAHYNLFGPVFIFVSAQSNDIDYWLEYSFVSQINEEQSGVVYGMEPRFYGESRPVNDLSIGNLRLLTIDQTLADLAEFVRFLRTELGDTKFILFGYGDGGSLATMAHQTYPGLFDGVWAVGAPTYIQLNFADYFADFQDTLLDYDRPCASIVGGGLEELDALFVAGNINQFNELFGFQHRLNLNNSKDISLVFYTITSILALKFEYGTQAVLSDLCAALLKNYGQGLSAVESLAREVRYNTEYANPSWDDTVALLGEINWDTPLSENNERQLWYTACTERSFFRTSTFFPEPVRSRYLVNIFLELCHDVFGIKAADIEAGNVETSAKYRLNINLPNVFFTYGGLDPFRLLGQTVDLNPSSPAAVIPGFGKTFELLGYLPQEYVHPEMAAVRAHVRSHILAILNN